MQTTNIKKYDNYKNSGIEWIGEIPQEWSLTRLKQHYHFEKGKNAALYTNEYIGQNEGLFPVYSGQTENEGIMGQVNNFDYNETLCVFTTTVGAKVMTPRLLSGKFCLSQNCLIMLKTGKLDERFLYYQLLPLFDYEKSLIPSYMQPSLRISDLKQYWVINCKEQQQISDYLDKKCGEIDNVIDTQKDIIKKLKEYKQAVITETVTKGLDKSAPLKDSGIEWIGKIPEHWKVITVARISNIVRGASPRPAGDKRYFGGDFCPWITVAELTKDETKYIVKTDEFLTEFGVSESRFIQAGTFLLSNSGATLGVPKITKISGCINDGSLAFLNITCNQDFLYYVLKSRTNEFRKQMQGYGQPNLNTTIIKAFKICIPTKNEQKQLADYLDKKCSEIDTAISEKEQLIEKLTEYKKSLIYECVTGKRKVA